MRNDGRAASGGFTVIELVMSVTIFAMLFGAVATVMVRDRSAARVVAGHVGPEVRARQALDRMVRELSMGSIRGEDRNSNGQLDAHEDVNENLVFDADWSLDDGAANASHLTFNRRLGVKDSKKVIAAGTAFSEGITYRRDGDRLVRVARRTDPETGDTVTQSALLAAGVTGLRFSRQGYVVTISIDVALPPGVYRDPQRTLTERVLLRN